MPIDVTCDACFTSHSVKSEHAGKRFKCRECGASLVVPKKQTAAAPSPTARRSSSGPSSKVKGGKRKASARSRRPAWAKGKLPWIAGGAAALLAILLIVSPRALQVLALPLALAGIAMTLWGALKCLASAFGEDPVCGLMWIFVPFYSVFYTLTRWNTVGKYFLTFVAGILLMWGPLYGSKLIADAQWAETQQTFDALTAEPATVPGPNFPSEGLMEPDRTDAASASGKAAEASDLPDQPAITSEGDGAPATAGAAVADESPGQPAHTGLMRGGREPQPPPASVLDGRPAPRRIRPDEIPMFHPVRNPVQPGISVWIVDKGWWYPGTVAELTDSPVRYMVRFEGWEDRPPQVANIAWIRERAAEAE